MGIMCVRPPASCASPVFDLLNEGAKGWRHLENQVAIREVHKVVMVRLNADEASELTLITSNTHTMELTFGGF